MPLIKREVEPVLVSKVDIGKDIKDELECVTNFTLASIIRQLGNLGKHAEDIFGDLLLDATGMSQRAQTLQDRIEKLNNTINKLDPLTDSVSLRNISESSAFQSSLGLEIEVVSSRTMPSAMRETYKKCEKPPALSLLNNFWEDGTDGMKMYTNPKFFFERWWTEQRKDIQGKKRRRKKKRPQSTGKVSQPKKVITTAEKYRDQALGVEFMGSKKTDSTDEEKQQSGERRKSRPESRGGSTSEEPMNETGNSQPKRISRAAPAPPPCLMPPPPVANATTPNDADTMPPPPPPLDEGYYASMDDEGMGVGDIAAPSPPPPPLLTNGPAMPRGSIHGAPPAPPPPPPAAPSPGGIAPPPPPLPDLNKPKANESAKGSTQASTVTQITVQDTRDNLLSAIKQGMKLRKVDINKDKDKRPNEPEPKSVEAILRRRIAVELSSDEGSSGDETDDSDWDDDD